MAKYRIDTDRFIDVWAHCVKEKKSWEQFIELVRQHFDNDSATDDDGNVLWNNADLDTCKASSIRSKCSSINDRISQFVGGKKLPIPQKTAQRRTKVDWADMVGKHSLEDLCEQLVSFVRGNGGTTFSGLLFLCGAQWDKGGLVSLVGILKQWTLCERYIPGSNSYLYLGRTTEHLF